MTLWERFLSADRPFLHEFLSFFLVIHTFFVLFRAPGSHPLSLELYFWLTSLSSAWAAHTSVPKTSSALFNLDAHDAFAFAVFARLRCSSSFLVCQMLIRHLTIASTGRILSPQVCRVLRELLQHPAVLSWSHWLDCLTLVELVFEAVRFRTVEVMACLIVYVVVLSTFRYVASPQHRSRWSELYAFVKKQWDVKGAGADGRSRFVLDIADGLSRLCGQMWPVALARQKLH
jgi:hypothetical protein